MEKQTNKIASFFLRIGQGITLGISAAIPGLSAGTIAVAEKVYDPLTSAIAELRKRFGKSFLYLLPFLLGMLAGALAALFGIKRGYAAAPFSLTGLFAGFVLGSVPVALSECKKGIDKKERAIHAIAFLTCLLIAAGLGIATALLPYDLAQALKERAWWIYPLIFLSGNLAAGACVVPGISGSMTLMVIGMYHPILNTYTGATSIFHSGDAAFKLTGMLLAVTFVLGALLGVAVTSRFMKGMLQRHRVSTFYAILGLILGSLVSMFINRDIYRLYPAIKAWDYILGSALFVLAALASFFLVTYAGKKKKAQSGEGE